MNTEAVDKVIDVLKDRGVDVRCRHFQRSTWFLLLDGDAVVELSVDDGLFCVDGDIQRFDEHAAATAAVESADQKRRAKVKAELRREAEAAKAVDEGATDCCPSCEDTAIRIGTDDMGAPSWVFVGDAEDGYPIDYCPYCGLKLPAAGHGEAT